MTKAFADPLFAGVALLCFAVSGAPLQAVAQSGTASSSLQIATQADASITQDIEGTAGTPAAVYTELSSIDLLFNSARISSGASDFGTGIFLWGTGVSDFINEGSIVGASGTGFYADTASFQTFTNTGTIAGGPYGVYLTRTPLGTFTNAGAIEGSADVSTSIAVSITYNDRPEVGGTFINQHDGQIIGSLRAVQLGAVNLASFTNLGTIKSRLDGIGLDIAGGSQIDQFINAAGARVEGDSVGLAITNSTVSTFINQGTIKGRTAITYEDSRDASSPGLTIINAGLIEGTDGIAIDFGRGELSYGTPPLPHDDTLILEDYAAVIGDILFAGGTDTLDVSKLKGGADLRVSGLENLITGDRVVIPDPWTGVPSDQVNDLSVEAVEAEVPEEETPPSNPPPPDPPTTRVVVVDPSTVVPNTVAQSTAGVVQGIAGLIGSQAMSAGYSGSLMSPAAAAGGSAVLTALDIGEAERPRVWGDIFGFGNSGPTPAQLSGVAVGADTRFGSAIAAGALLSYSQSVASFTAGDTLASRTGVAGFYGTYHAGVLDVGFSLLGGVQAHESSRRIATAGGFETARGSFGGVFAAPGASAALPLASIGGTAVALRASATYVVGVTSGYTETGSSSNLTIGPRPITSLDARLGLEARHAIIAGSLAGEGVVRAGVFGLMNGGGASVPVTLFGQTVNVATTPSSVYGVYAGAGAVANLSETIRFELNADTAVRTDGSLSLSLRGGVSGTF